MRVLISGSSGLIGRAVGERLRADDHTIVPFQRTSTPGESNSIWEPIHAGHWNETVGPIDAVVHLAGESIAARRWTAAQKKRIRDSRVLGTRQLCEHLAGLEKPPSVIVAASAVGYYGDRGDEILTESSPSGDGFLAEVCREWEAATQAARDAGIRVVNLRIGVVLSKEGGTLERLLPLFRLGLGAKLGSGRQFMSWVHIDDLIEIIMLSINDSSLIGPVNAVAPEPATNREFTRTLSRQLNRPAWFAVPGAILRLVAGEMADELVLSSARAIPKKLPDNGFSFRYPSLQAALGEILA